MKKIVLIFILFFCLLESVQAQRYPFRSFSIEQGLSESVVYDIVQDDDGYIWLATGFGLNRYDGINFRNYFEEQGLNSSRLRSLLKDDQGRIWVGSESGVNVIEDDSIHADPDYRALNNSTVISIYQDTLGDMWFGTDGNGVWHYSDGIQIAQYTTSNGLGNNRVRAIAESEDGTLWFATRGGLTVLESGNFRTYNLDDG